MTPGVRSIGRGAGAEEVERLLEGNRGWVDERLREDPAVFQRLERGQHPPFLFVGCCDSRKPLDSITRTRPGELFIHRNIANLLPAGDPAAAAVLEFAMEALEVRHLIVCGHTRCGGIRAGLAGVSEGDVGAWLAPVRGLAERHENELSAFESEEARTDRLAALNVVAQLEEALRVPAVSRRLRGDGAPLHLHGWLFHVESGYLEVLSLPADRWSREGLLPEGVLDGAKEAEEPGA